METRRRFLTAGCALLCLTLAVPAWAQMGGMGGHGGQMGGGGMGGGGMSMGPKPDPGEVMNQGTVDGYTVRFHNMPMKMEGITNHLMVYIIQADGKTAVGGNAAYEITGPDGTVQKVMCRAMGNGFGGNVDFSKPGRYGVTLKAGIGTQSLVYSFEYNVK